MIADLQGATCRVAVICGGRMPDLLMTEMLSRLGGGGQLPHYFVMKCLGDFAVSMRMWKANCAVVLSSSFLCRGSLDARD